MTVAGIIEQYNTERPNSVEDSLKLGWLEKCERMIIDTVILTHEDAPCEEDIEDHIANFGMDTELYVNEPYDDLYLYFLDQRIAMNNNDNKRLNTASTYYNNALLTYQQQYTRKHMSLRARKRLLRHEVL